MNYISFDINKIREKASFKKQIRFFQEVIVLCVLGIVSVWGVVFLNQWYEKYLEEKLSYFKVCDKVIIIVIATLTLIYFNYKRPCLFSAQVTQAVLSGINSIRAVGIGPAQRIQAPNWTFSTLSNAVSNLVNLI